MKILHTVEHYYPSVGGMQEVVQHISECLVNMGHEVTIATMKDPQRAIRIINGVNIVEFEISGNYIMGIDGDSESYKNFLLNSNFDIITNFAAQHWATDLMFPILEKIRAKKVFVPTGFSGLLLPQYHEYYENMKDWMKKYDMNIFLSNNYRDINFARNNKIEKITIIPNGASRNEFCPGPDIKIRERLDIPDEHFLILLVGSHTLLKGHKEAIKIFSKAKLNNSTFVIIGNIYSKQCYLTCKLKEFFINLNPINILNSRQLIVDQLSRSDTIALYKSANLFLFPSNVECSPLVLFECMAAKLPFLTTDVGNSKEIIEWSNGGKLLPTKIDKNGISHANILKSAKMVKFLSTHPQLLKKFAENGFNAWQNNFSWESIAEQYEHLYIRLIAEQY